MKKIAKKVKIFIGDNNNHIATTTYSETPVETEHNKESKEWNQVISKLPTWPNI